jgi:hypothetical protein
MSEPWDHGAPKVLADAHAVTWQIVQLIDQGW